MKKILVFKEHTYEEYPLINQVKIDDNIYLLRSEKVYTIRNEIYQLVQENRKYEYDGTNLMILDDINFRKFEKKETILFGNKNADIVCNIHTNLVYVNDKLLNENEYDLYYNGKLTKQREINIKNGDYILVDCVLILFQEQAVLIFSELKSIHSSLKELNNETMYFERFPEYMRSPRLIKKLRNDALTILKPPANIPRKKGSLAKVVIPPLGMAAVSVMSAFVMGRGIFVIVALAGTAVTLVLSIVTFFQENKELKKKNAKRREVYEQYLLDLTKKLDQYRQNENETYHYNNPNLQELEQMVLRYSPRIFERDVNDDDFISIKIGEYKGKSEYDVKLDYDALEIEKDELLEEAKQLFNDYQWIEKKPLLVDLKKSHVGIVGEKKDIHNQIKNMLAQLTFFQSYHDIEIIMLYNEQYKSEFEYIKWYPHVKLHNVNLTGSIYNERVRDQVLGSLNQILKDRRNKMDEHKREMRYFPHYVVIVDDYHLIMSHSIMEYLQDVTTDLGFTLIYTAQKRANLPENIKTVIMMEDKETATLLLAEGHEINQRVKVEKVNNIKFEEMARNLFSLNHLKGVSTHIPEMVTFFDMYGVENPEELNILDRWEQGESHKTLAVPLGLRAENDLVELNLHEKAHGPHGLVAGTTGSGKSEIIQSYILSLATNFSPYEVGFLLIDYKGGGMANLFKNLPHLLGTITNLDGAESMRALASIKAELGRRQRIFNEHEVNNINKYNRLFKQGKAKEPLPHLFIISDEFAELKKEQPEFMSELVSVARIGRTLGVHLILATQKPTGVVDDQIWSNSKFKLALKVQDESDSKEIIKTPDASFITVPGRAYLQVGNNEIYEMFQSAWSGANYSSVEETNKVDSRIYKINILGQSELINKDLSEMDTKDEGQVSQLDAVVDHISKVYGETEWLTVRKPWLPTLGKVIPSPYINLDTNINLVNGIDLKIPLGIVDVPEHQEQKDYILNLIEDGNSAIFASSGFGKTVSLGTVLMTLAVKNNPKYLNFYILDFGNSGLMPYKKLPHTADYLTFDHVEKITKFRSLIEKEIKDRKRILGQAMAQNFDMYNKMHKDNPLRAIIVMIDNFDVVKEVSIEFEEFITKMTRDGVGLGIYTIISATRTNGVRYATLNNFKKKIVQYLFDENEISNLVGKSPYKLNEIKGRALIKDKIISIMQIYVPAAFEDEVELIEKTQEIIQALNDIYTGDKVRGIPVLPEVFTTNDFKEYDLRSVSTDLIGLSLDDVKLVSAQIETSPFVIIGPIKGGKTNALEILLNQDKEKRFVFDSSSLELYKYKGNTSIIYVDKPDEVESFIHELTNEIATRKQGLEKTLAIKSNVNPKDYFKSLNNWSIYIDDADDFIEKVKNIPNIVLLMQDATNTGIRIIATVASSKMKGFDELSKYFKTTISGLVLGNQGAVNIFPIANMRDVPTFGNGLLYNSGVATKIMLPKMGEEKINE